MTDTPRLKRQRRVLMHVFDAYTTDQGPMCRMRCKKCEATTGWITFATATEAKHGFPCPECNFEDDEEE